MSSGEGTPARRLRLVPARRLSTVDEAPRVEALDALLREVDDLRLTLETDLTLAASAVESGEPGIAADILGADRAALNVFQERALEHLAELDGPRRTWWAQAHAAPIVAAAALVGVLIGVVPQAVVPGPDASPHSVAASESLLRLQESAESGDEAEVRAASFQLHRQLAGVLANATSDPAAARTALLLLTYEQSAIARSGDSSALADVMRQSKALAAAIVAALPQSARGSLPSVDPVVAKPSASPTPTPAPRPSGTASPSPSPSQSAGPQPSASPTPTRDTDPYPLPSAPVTP